LQGRARRGKSAAKQGFIFVNFSARRGASRGVAGLRDAAQSAATQGFFLHSAKRGSVMLRPAGQRRAWRGYFVRFHYALPRPASHSGARRGGAGIGNAKLGNAQRRSARLSGARQGKVLFINFHGPLPRVGARLGLARQGKVLFINFAQLGSAAHCTALLGAARRNRARQGNARKGEAMRRGATQGFFYQFSQRSAEPCCAPRSTAARSAAKQGYFIHLPPAWHGVDRRCGAALGMA
jgi:hypothetical protein